MLHAILKRSLRILLVTGLVLALGGVVAYFAYDWYIRNELAAATAEADRVDPRWRLEDIEADRIKVPDAENSALQAMKAAELMKQHRGFGLDFDAIFKDLPRTARLNEQQIKYLRDHTVPRANGLAAALALKDMPLGRSPGNCWSEFPKFSFPSEGSGDLKFAVLYYCLELADTDPNAAMRANRAQINNGRSMGDDPAMISQLMRNNSDREALATLERILAQGEVNTAELEATQELLEKEAAELSWVQGIRGERAGNFFAVTLMLARKVQPSQIPTFPVKKAPWWIDYLPQWHVRNEASQIRHYTRVLEAAKKPLHEQMDAVKEIDASFQRADAMKVPLANIVNSHCTAVALVRATTVGLACEHYRLDHKRWPARLEEVVEAKLLKSIPDDPFNGKPLRFVRNKDHVTIYSVGIDRKDNGGNVPESQGLISSAEAEMDLGFRLWDVAARRGPPRPPVELKKVNPLDPQENP